MNALAAWAAASLLNALWQTALIFSAAWVVARLLRPLGAAAEHRVWVGALLLEAALPFCRLQPAHWWQHLRALFASADEGGVSVQIEVLSVGQATHPGMPSLVQRALAAALAVGIVVAAVWLAGRLWQTRRLLRESEELEPEGELARRLEQCACAVGVAADGVRVALHAGLRGPATVGLWRPTLLLPADFATEFLRQSEGEAAEELETALAHELEHIRRRDFAKNLFYELVSLPVAWHPLAMLTRGQINQTREMVCDRQAAAALAGNGRYARALVRLAARMALRPEPRALAAMGIFDGNIFERRIMQLTTKRSELGSVRRWALLAASAAIAVGTCLSAMAMQADVKPAAEAKNGVVGPGASETVAGLVPPSLPVAPVAAKEPAEARNGVAELSASEAVANLISKVTPKYPAEAKKARVEGTVELKAIIGEDGHMQNLQAISGPPELIQPAMEAVQQWVYRPYLLNGKPTKVETLISVIYTLGGQPPAGSESAAPSQSPSDTPPTARIEVTYPPEARSTHQEGVVLVTVKVDAEGHPTVLALEGPEVFQKAAREAVAKSAFRPAMKNGRPVEATVKIEVNFKLFDKKPKA